MIRGVPLRRPAAIGVAVSPSVARSSCSRSVSTRARPPLSAGAQGTRSSSGVAACRERGCAADSRAARAPSRGTSARRSRLGALRAHRVRPRPLRLRRRSLSEGARGIAEGRARSRRMVRVRGRARDGAGRRAGRATARVDRARACDRSRGMRAPSKWPAARRSKPEILPKRRGSWRLLLARLPDGTRAHRELELAAQRGGAARSRAVENPYRHARRGRLKH